MFDFVQGTENKEFKYPLIEINGGLVHVYDQVINEIENELASSLNNKKAKVGSLFVVKQMTSDIERLINSSEIVDLSYTFAAVEYSLEQSNFRFTPKVTEMGDFSRIGDVISFWPIGYSNPIRIEFFDDRIEKMYQFDAIFGRRINKIDDVLVSRIDILDDKVEWQNITVRPIKAEEGTNDYKIISERNLQKFDKLEKTNVLIINFGTTKKEKLFSIDLHLSYPALFFSRMDLFAQEINKKLNTGAGWKVRIETSHRDLLPKKMQKYIINDGPRLTAGFENQDTKEIYYTDRELFGTIFITREKQKRLNSSEAKKLLDYIEGEIEIGNYIVHSDHGIGIYSGISREKDQDYLNIKYAEGDELLVPLDQIHKITKYIGVSNEPSQITRLNKINWKEVTKKARKLIGIIAKDLASHYAKIELAKARAIQNKDSEKYRQFAADFGYIETEDQKRTISEVLKDIEKTKPMNRLIVGDVGFGKTEVAMRVTFRIVESGMQVAVLAPTTVLAAQHFKVFKDRFSKYGMEIGMLSRFTKGDETKKNIDLLNAGKLDIVIGTHRLLSSDVKFKNLGLVIIDEEQKFGVRQKEKLKKLKYGAHILSMTATPIPRTLSMALSQIQDISIISTPPQGRKSVKTEVERFDWDKIRQAVKFEKDRGGQVYFVHNRVETINTVYQSLINLLPSIKFVVAHAQMNEVKLENVINDFYAKKYDCLICTTIIENGIDMPNVNTIIIDKAQNFGLGQLYQLRGRVGRSKKQAFAYMFYDGEDINKDENSDKFDENENEGIDNTPKKNTKYIDRLKAIMESQELGAGFKIASRDLEIRGAGNLLGSEQHGQISKIGLALYMQMLAEEIEKVKITQENHQ